ncbi:MAG: cytidylate kinase family protein [Desulfobacterales bacterium]
MKFITVSRQLGSNGGIVARQVADKLGYKFHDTGSIDNLALKMGFLKSVADSDEHPPSFFKRYFSHKPAINQERLNSVIYELAKQGDGVFLGRGGHILLKSFTCALHVRVIASHEKRVHNLVQRGFNEHSALRAIEESDRERAGFISYAFGKDWDNPGLYDLILNMDKLSIGLAVDSLVAVARSEDITSCSLDSMQSLAKMALAARAEAAIEEAGLAYGPSLAVNVSVEEIGKVRLEGTVGDEKSKVRAEEVVRYVNGVEAVENRIRVRPADRHA